MILMDESFSVNFLPSIFNNIDKNDVASIFSMIIFYIIILYYIIKSNIIILDHIIFCI